ncbi:TetR-like C-terminal domain-containing protein [Streptomyces tendae]|uniref:TetR-like C-terminal domain-containing protein n=1 Tax=Streptomyces tendae TaxID=1932 RepID=UPI00381F0EA0
MAQPDVGGAHRRDHGGADREAADEQRGHERGPAGAGGDEGERHRGHGDEGEGGDGDPAGAGAVHVPARQTACEQRPGALRDEQEPGAEDVPADALAEVYDRAVARGEARAERLTGRVRSLPFDLLRQEILATLAPVPDDVVAEIVDTVFLPLVR